MKNNSERKIKIIGVVFIFLITVFSPATNLIVSAGNWGTPQEYHGDPEGRGPGRIIVKGFDYSSVSNMRAKWQGKYWTASNGVEIKVIKVEGAPNGVMVVPDGKGKDIIPCSPYYLAVCEAEGIDVNRYKTDFSETLPPASYKRTEIDYDDAAVVAYKNAYDFKLWRLNGYPEEGWGPYQSGSPVNMTLPVMSDGVGEVDELGARFWEIDRRGDYWAVTLYKALEEFRWDGLHQFLRYLSPDGDAIYQVIYEDIYFGSPTILEYNEWFAVGNSQIYQEDPKQHMGRQTYRFK